VLENVGAAGLSLRQLSERAELSRQAAYNHFVDKQALLAELAVAGFERLMAAVRQASAGPVRASQPWSVPRTPISRSQRVRPRKSF
jgi:AcrR family transcriptional regulator